MEEVPPTFAEAYRAIQDVRKREADAQNSGGRRSPRIELAPAPMSAALALAARRLRTVGMHDDVTLRFLRSQFARILRRVLHDTNIVYRREGVAQRLARARVP